MPDWLRLTPAQVRIAREVGTGRYRYDRHKGWIARQGVVGVLAGEENDCQAAGAEFAVSDMLGQPWTGKPIGRLDLPDVGDFIEVRQTWRPNGCLIVHSPPGVVDPNGHDHPDRAFVLVVGTLETGYEMKGWAWGHEAQVPTFWRKDLPRPCHMMDQIFQRPVDPLREVIRNWR